MSTATAAPTVSPERVARLCEMGLTRYGAEMADEINVARATLDEAEAEYEAILAEAAALYTPTDPADCWIGWWGYLPEPMQRIYDAANDTDRLSWDRGGHGNEAFPLTVWRRNAKAFCRQTKKIRAAIAAARCTRSSAAERPDAAGETGR